MAYLLEADVRKRAATQSATLRKSINELLTVRADSISTFDVFLSHSSNEPDDLLLGIKAMMNDRDLSVYVDKYTDPGLSRDKVDQKTAEVIRMRMRQSRSLLYVYSQHSTLSRWMPWELGYFDGFKGKVGVIPVLPKEPTTRFQGEEYLSLYPYVDATGSTFWINSPTAYSHYARLVEWTQGKAEIVKVL